MRIIRFVFFLFIRDIIILLIYKEMKPKTYTYIFILKKFEIKKKPKRLNGLVILAKIVVLVSINVCLTVD